MFQKTVLIQVHNKRYNAIYFVFRGNYLNYIYGT